MARTGVSTVVLSNTALPGDAQPSCQRRQSQADRVVISDQTCDVHGRVPSGNLSHKVRRGSAAADQQFGATDPVMTQVFTDLAGFPQLRYSDQEIAADRLDPDGCSIHMMRQI